MKRRLTTLIFSAVMLLGSAVALAGQVGIIVPSYFYPGTGGPGGSGDGWASMAQAAATVPITAILKSPSRIGKSAAFRRTKVPRKGKRHIEELRDQQWGFCFPAVRALAKNETAEDADLRSKSPSALVADCAPSGASAETTGFSRWSVHTHSSPARLATSHRSLYK